ncbi:hypothetical protein P261_00577 [Lachnospiraceae bacterium TWA4]|nr:hypothetical protein P261_00577 [Lachnospiraceae bacterium TWA4]
MAPNYFLYDLSQLHMTKHKIKPNKITTISNLFSATSLIAKNENSGFTYMPDYFIHEILDTPFAQSLGFFQIGSETLDWAFAMMYKRNHKLSKQGTIFI